MKINRIVLALLATAMVLTISSQLLALRRGIEIPVLILIAGSAAVLVCACVLIGLDLREARRRRRSDPH